MVFQKQYQRKFIEAFGDKFYTFTLEDWVFAPEFTQEKLLKHFDVNSLKGFGVDDLEAGTIAAGAALHYLVETQHHQVKHIANLHRIEEEHHVWMDRFTIRNLELFYSANEGAITLVDVLDHSITPMGSRMLKRWLAFPLKEKCPIEERFSVVEQLIQDISLSELIQKHIKEIGDLERLISKVATGRINPREVAQLKRALKSIDPIQKACQSSGNNALETISKQLNPCILIRDRIANELEEEPPVALHKGGVIAIGVNAELDELRKIALSSQEHLQKILKRETELTGIPSLKIAFNNVFGYYLEVRNTHKDKVPEE